jgi:hypothetical protein
MQTAKVKVGECYALRRGDKLVRFYCTEIVTRKSHKDNTSSEFFGNVLEDKREGEPAISISINTQDLLGPYDEQAELVARRDQEAAERKARQDEREAQIKSDRLALYKFVGVTPPKKLDDYHQLFRCSYASLSISTEGAAAIVARIRALQKVPA